MRRVTATAALRGRIALCAATATCALALGATGASAAEPTLRITAPAPGSYTSQGAPLIVGSLEPDEAVWCGVTVKIYSGTAAEGVPVQEVPLEASSLCTNWQATPSPLGEGTYTVLAEETREILNSEGEEEPASPATSAPVTFTVDATAPAPAISSPSPGSTFFTGAIPVTGTVGTARGDDESVLVHVFAGSDGSTPVESVEIAAPGGSWSGALAGLAPGSYTLSAEQRDAAGNTGTSPPVPIAVLAPPAPLPPKASFTWFPEVPRVGETVTLVSSSTDTSSPLTSFAWALTGTEPFHAGLPTTTTTFATPGPHVVRLQVADAAGRTAVATKTITVRHQALALMQPFPIVRIAGRETRNGVKLTLLTVSAPISALVTVRIRGTGIRSTSQSRIAAAGKHPSPGGAALLSFPRFARSLKAGVVLEIRVTKAGEIGKLTRFIPRRGKLPTRTDLCLSSSSKPMTCPAS